MVKRGSRDFIFHCDPNVFDTVTAPKFGLWIFRITFGIEINERGSSFQ